MASPLVETKLYVPQVRRGAVPRPRLAGLLDGGEDARLTLVSAPAGFGKTTLLASWLHGVPGRRVAWLSLDARDADPVAFWTGLVAALRTAVPGIGADAVPLLESAQGSVESVLAGLLNELAAGTEPVHVVLDDYHLADGPGIRDGMAFLLEHLPPHVHLVLSTRADPALPLARLRARGELVEVRAADLRFTAEEAAAYLGAAVDADLSDADVAALEERTEGWIAALQLAALSLRGREDVSGFIGGFAGDDRYVVDYLVEEVLGRQPDDVRAFLLQTSVLERLSGPLCDAVTGGSDGRTVLETLERTNLFVVPLDDSRRWYRYHHLFADVLRTHLAAERPDEVAGLHRRASAWYADAGEPVPAVAHALAAGDPDRAAELVEGAIPDLQRNRQEAQIRSWLDDLPDDVVRRRPVLAVGLVGALMSRGEFAGVEERLDDVDRLLADGTGLVVADPAGPARLPGTMQMYRAALSLVGGDLAATARHAERAVELAAPDDDLVRAGASALSGLARWPTGDLDAAHAAYSRAVDGLERVGHVADVLGCSLALADMEVTQGRLADARRTLERALRLAGGSTTPLRGTADMHLALARVAWERGDPAARDHLQRALDLGEAAGLPQHPYRWRVLRAELLAADGDVAAALSLLDEAERVYTGDFSPDVRPVAATRARVLVAGGDLAGAGAWAREHGVGADDDPSYVREHEHLTLARLLLARHRADRDEAALADATRLLARLRTAAAEGGRDGTLVEVLVLQALAAQAAGDRDAASAHLDEALGLAEPEGHARPFLDPDAAPLLTGRAGAAWLPAPAAAGPSAPTRRTPTPALPEPLSDRELEVLRLLAGDLDGPDIARHLHVSLNTLRTHTRHVYAKLGVTSRRAAVRRARELDLLAR